MECKRIYFPCANLLALWGKGVINKDLLFLLCAGEGGVCTGVKWDDGVSLANAVLVPRETEAGKKTTAESSQKTVKKFLSPVRAGDKFRIRSYKWSEVRSITTAGNELGGGAGRSLVAHPGAFLVGRWPLNLSHGSPWLIALISRLTCRHT